MTAGKPSLTAERFAWLTCVLVQQRRFGPTLNTDIIHHSLFTAPRKGREDIEFTSLKPAVSAADGNEKVYWGLRARPSGSGSLPGIVRAKNQDGILGDEIPSKPRLADTERLKSTNYKNFKHTLEDGKRERMVRLGVSFI